MPDELVHGWGRTAPVRCAVTTADARSVEALVSRAGDRGVLARGLGRSYGDAAQNSGGVLVRADLQEVEVDEPAGTVTVSAGTSLHDLVRVLLPRGLALPVLPGTRQVTVGGAIAADVHGKNHVRDGSLAHHVVSFDLVGPDARTRTVSPAEHPELFWSTLGGMGLTGVVVRAVLRVRPVETGYVSVTTERLPDLGTLLSRMEAIPQAAYSAAWVDLIARGRSLGRAVLGTGEDAGLADLDPARSADPLAPPRDSRLRVPVTPPRSLVTRSTARVFNELWFRRTPPGPRRTLEHVGDFLQPLDAIDGWNRLYGPHGLVQYQLAVPLGAEDVLHDVVARVAASRTSPFLGVLKRLGPGDQGWLSFPIEGWTLAVDFPVSVELAALFRELDERVLRAGGRIYLAKDARCTPETIRGMYPRAEEFRALREATGADRVFVSDLSRRLAL